MIAARGARTEGAYAERRREMVGKKKSLFISDIHIGALKKDKTNKGWDWYNPKTDGAQLSSFLKYLEQRQKKNDDIKELVLLGDVFDLWVCPHDQKPHTFEEIIEAQRDIVKDIKALTKTVPVIYVNGNHDFRVSPRLDS